MRKWYAPLVMVAAVAFSIAVYPRLPDRMPVHFGFSGQPDRYGSRLEGLTVLPVVALATWLLLNFLPKIDPRRANYAKFAGSYALVIDALVTFFVLLHVAIIGFALGWPISIRRVVPAVFGILLVVLGNVLPRARPNWWFGVRTPWTLSNDRVWTRTHRVAGYLMFPCGLLLLLAALVPTPWTLGIAIACAVAASLVPVVYSYFAWKRETST